MEHYGTYGKSVYHYGTLGEIDFYEDEGVNVARQPVEVLVARISS